MSTYFYGPSAKDSKYYFRLRDNNNEIILASTEGYNSEQGCLSGINSVKLHSPYDHNYTRFVGYDGKSYFTLKASNGEPIGKSEGYNSNSNRDRGIENCKKEAPSASIVKIANF